MGWGPPYYRLCQYRLGQGLARAAVAGLRRCGFLRRFHMPVDALTLEGDAVSGLMRLWSRIHWSSGDGMMPPEQLLAVYRLAVEWPGRGDVVELGSWVGLTTSYLATACRVRGEGRVHAVDTFEGTKEGGGRYRSVEKYGGSTLQTFADNLDRAGVGDLVETFVGYTAEVVQRYCGRPVRMLLIDADHSYAAVRTDFELWSPLVMPGGLIVFHDYLIDDVARFVDTEVAADARFEMAPGQVVPNVMAVTKRPEVGTRSGPRSAPCRAGRVEPEAAAV